jgi:hypothetical protein
MTPAPSPEGFWNLAGPDFIVLGLIMLFCGLPYVVVIGFMAARKGRSVPLFCILCFIPIVNVVASIWLASLTDTAVNSRLASLEKRTPPPI